MKITPGRANAGSPVTMTTTNNSSARDRAITMLENNLSKPPQVSQHATQNSAPVPNPSQVSPEELGAVRTQSEQTEIQANTDVQTSDQTQAPADTGETKKADPKASEPLSAHYAQLARKERAIRAKAQEIRAREDAVKAQEAAAKAKETSLYSDEALNSRIKERLAKDPIKTLQDAGWSYEQITNLFLNQPNPEEIVRNQAFDELRAETRAVKAELEQQRKLANEATQAQYQQAVQQIHREVKNLVSADDNFETIRETRSERDVTDLIEKTFKADGVLLSVEEAAQAVEDYLVEEGAKIARIKKIQQRLKPATPAEPAKATGQPQSPEAQKQSQNKTLTNNMGTSRKLSSKERAILAFKGELKN